MATPGYDSKEELWVAIALTQLKIPFTYQYEVRGGSRYRGGFIIDFVVENPFETPLEVFGEHWHSGQLGSDDKWRLAILRQMFGREPIVLWGSELQDPQQAMQAVQAKVL